MSDIDSSFDISRHNISVMSAQENTTQNHQRTKSAIYMPILEMYKLTKRRIPWGLDSYETPKEYLDSKLLAQVREGKQKTQPPKPTKRGSYLDDELKGKTNLPGPDQYSPRNEEKRKESMKIKNTSNRITFIDNIINDGKKSPTPGPNTYKILKDDKDIEAELQKLRTRAKRETERERGNFLLQVQYTSAMIPGPGTYNPSPIMNKMREDKTKPEHWRKKHSSLTPLFKTPDAATYHPIPTDFHTFQKYIEMAANHKEFKRKSSIDAAERFKKPKEKDNFIPGPGTYSVCSIWPSKGSKSDKKDKNSDILYRISRAPEISIYYKQK